MTSGAAPRPTRRRNPVAIVRRRRQSAASAPVRPRDRTDRAPLVDHLSELRSRLLWCAAWLVAAFALCYSQLDLLFDLLDRPLDDRWPLQTLGVTEPFFTSLAVAAQAAFVLTTPVLAWHAWRFVRPAIEPSARRTVKWLLVVAPALFTGGVVFAYLLILGPAVQFLLGMGPDSIDVVVRANEYYHFVTTTLLAIGLAFCFPLVLLGLARVGILSEQRLRSSRRVAYALMVIVAALLPTADPVSLALEILPLWGLYELSILAVRVQERMLRRRGADSGTDNTPAPSAPAG